MRKTPPKVIDIAMFWQQERKFVPYIDEPACFACGWSRWWNGVEQSSNIAVAWNQSRLERAHIVADYIGGSNHVMNFLLLCKRCHLEAPMTNDREVMLNWAKRRESFSFWFAKLFETVRSEVDLTDAHIAKLSGLTNEDLIAEAERLQVDMDCRRGESVPHLSGILAACRSLASRIV